MSGHIQRDKDVFEQLEDAREVLLALFHWFNEGGAPLHSGALIFDDDEITVKDAIYRALYPKYPFRGE